MNVEINLSSGWHFYLLLFYAYLYISIAIKFCQNLDIN
jgi:hypothetical protein